MGPGGTPRDPESRIRDSRRKAARSPSPSVSAPYRFRYRPAGKASQEAYWSGSVDTYLIVPNPKVPKVCWSPPPLDPYSIRGGVEKSAPDTPSASLS